MALYLVLRLLVEDEQGGVRGTLIRFFYKSITIDKDTEHVSKPFHAFQSVLIPL